MGEPSETWHLFFSGRVQGVGFRYTCLRAAGNCDVVGWVRNLTNGDVEMLAQSNPQSLRLLVEQITETTYGQVDDIRKTVRQTVESFDSFEIRTGA